MTHINLDSNHIAPEGPAKRSPAWERWVDVYIHTFARMTYWSAESGNVDDFIENIRCRIATLITVCKILLKLTRFFSYVSSVNDVFKGAILSLSRWLRLKVAYENGFFLILIILTLRSSTPVVSQRSKRYLGDSSPSTCILESRRGLLKTYGNPVNARSLMINDVRHFGIIAYSTPRNTCDSICFQKLSTSVLHENSL